MASSSIFCIIVAAVCLILSILLCIYSHFVKKWEEANGIVHEEPVQKKRKRRVPESEMSDFDKLMAKREKRAGRFF